MPHVPILPPEQAPKEVNAVYEEFYRRMSFPSPPNFIMTQGHSSTVVRGTWEAVRNILVTGDASPVAERDDVCGDLQGSKLSLLHGGAHCVLSHVGREA